MDHQTFTLVATTANGEEGDGKDGEKEIEGVHYYPTLPISFQSFVSIVQ